MRLLEHNISTYRNANIRDLFCKFLYIETTKCIDIETLQKCFLHIEIIRLAARRLTTMLGIYKVSLD